MFLLTPSSLICFFRWNRWKTAMQQWWRRRWFCILRCIIMASENYRGGGTPLKLEIPARRKMYGFVPSIRGSKPLLLTMLQSGCFMATRPLLTFFPSLMITSKALKIFLKSFTREVLSGHLPKQAIMRWEFHCQMIILCAVCRQWISLGVGLESRMISYRQPSGRRLSILTWSASHRQGACETSWNFVAWSEYISMKKIDLLFFFFVCVCIINFMFLELEENRSWYSDHLVIGLTWLCCNNFFCIFFIVYIFFSV